MITGAICKTCGIDHSATYGKCPGLFRKPEWNGEGLPPVGCECEAYDGAVWYPAVVVGHYDGFAFLWNYDHQITFTVNEIDSHNLRLIRTEAEIRREDTKNAIAELCRASASNGHSADLIYDAIAAGKIPHITLK